MKEYKEGRYYYYIIPESRIVKCVSTYGKKPFVGIAKCDEKDTFDENIGKRIARVKCDNKINRRRIKVLQRDMDIAFDNVRYWEAKHSMLCQLMRTADKERRELVFAVDEIKTY